MSETLSLASFPYTGPDSFEVSKVMKNTFNEFGFVVVKKLFSREEVAKLVNFFASFEVRTRLLFTAACFLAERQITETT